MRIVDLIKNENRSIKWIRDEFNKGNLFVDDSFQRRYVWLKKHKISLIETILMGYVIPEIYIWEVGLNPETGDIKYSIVDGQQRIGAIVEYINGNFPLNKNYLEVKDADYAGKKFSDLSDDYKSKIWGYSLSSRTIHKDVSRENIVSLFLRLNSTNKSLNPQELRNAEYDGLFLKNAIDIAKMEFWQKYDVFGSDALRRMGDVEFISSILLFLRRGINSEITQNDINQAYDLYNEEYDEAEDDKRIIADVLLNIEAIIAKNPNIISFIKKTSHLYTIFIVVYKCLLDNVSLTEGQIDNLLRFYSEYESSNDPLASEYRTLLQSGTRSKVNRMQRVAILSGFVEGKNQLTNK